MDKEPLGSPALDLGRGSEQEPHEKHVKEAASEGQCFLAVVRCGQ